MRTDIQQAPRDMSLDDFVDRASWPETLVTAFAVTVAIGFVSFVAVVMSMS